MAGLSSELNDALLNYYFRGVPFTRPDHFYIGLYIGDPDADGEEVSGNDYTRVLHDTFNAPVENILTNDGAVQFPTPTGSWGIVTHFGIFTSLESEDTPKWSGPLPAPQSIGVNNNIVFPNMSLGARLKAA